MLKKLSPGMLLFLIAFILFANLSVSAQITGRGSISGIVTDSSGAAVANAQVKIIDEATNVSQLSETNATGYFEVNNLNPSSYKIIVTAPGFTNLVRDGITLLASAHIKLPLALTVGNTAETVTVTADASLLNTETGSTGQVLTTKQIESLPSSGANPMQLVSMAPGIQAPNSQVFSASDTLSWNGVSKFGATGYLNANEFIVDGSPNMGNPRGNAIQLSQEEVDQMKIDAVSFEAEMGHTMGAMITQTTKSGTNQFHGSIHAFYQDAAWASMQHFQGLNYRYQQAINNCTKGEKTNAKCFLLKYQYGNPGTHVNIGSYAVGGPVLLPKLFNGKDKLFFFVAVDNNIWKDASVNTTSIPTVVERSGDFSDLPATTSNVPKAFTDACGSNTPYYGQYQLYNPFSMALDAKSVPRRKPFCGNVIPSSMLGVNGSLSKFYNTLLPNPTQNSPTGSNLVYTAVSSYTFRQFTQRMDYALSQNDHLFFRWSRAHYYKEQSGFTVGNVDRQVSPKWIELGSLGYNRVFGASTDLAITVGGSSWKTGCCYYPGYQEYSASSVGLPSYLDSYNGAKQTLPLFSVGSYKQVGQDNNSRATYRNLSVSGVLNHIHGSHSLKAGAEWRQQSFSQAAQGNTSGTYSFDATYMQQNNGSDSAYTQSTWGLSYGAFLLGVPTTSSIGWSDSISIRTPYYAVYVGDNWRINRKLTFIPGVRFEYEYGPAEMRNHQIVGWDSEASLPIATAANGAYQTALNGATADQKAVLPTTLTIKGGPVYAGVNGAPTRQFVNNYRVLPRIAIAYQLNASTVIRGGYGIFSDTINAHDAGGSPHSSISGATGTWSGVQFTPNQDGYSTSTSNASSTNYGANFKEGTTTLSDPFPVVNGSRFNTPIGSAAGAMYYLGSSPTIYDHNMVPSRAQRGYVGLQHQFGPSTMVELAWIGSFATKIPMGRSISVVPSSFYAGGDQPNNAARTLLATQITNPFAIGNFASFAGSTPEAYNIMAHSSYYTAAKSNISNFVRANPQMGGFSMYRSIGESHFNELQVNASKRYRDGLTFSGSLQLNKQNDRDYFANSYDASPSWQPSNNSMPYRITAYGLYELPIGKGKRWLSSGAAGRLLGGFQLGASWERQPGPLIQFSNLFYVGKPGSHIKLKHPVYVNGLASGGSNYIQWLDVGNVTTTYANGTCSYTGTGFVTNANCQPTSYNVRVFPQRVDGVRSQATDSIQMSVQKIFLLSDRVKLETRCEAYNLLNRQVLGGPNTTPTAVNFGRITSDGTSNGAGNSRWVTIQGRLRF